MNCKALVALGEHRKENALHWTMPWSGVIASPTRISCARTGTNALTAYGLRPSTQDRFQGPGGEMTDLTTEVGFR